MTARKASALALLAALASPAIAAELPTPSEHDARVRVVNYVLDQVTLIQVRRGSVTRIVFEPDEKIITAASGFAADCTKPEHEWCVRADVGTHQIWIKPKENATFNNLEVHTSKRDYSLEFQVLRDAPERRQGPASAKAPRADALKKEPMFRVLFQYPPARSLTAQLSGQLAAPHAGTDTSNPDRAAPTVSPRNWSYSMQVLKGADDIAPNLVFDDGRFTYFQFPANREVPSIFAVSRDGEEGRVNYHMQDADLVAVERLARMFVLRLGSAVVGIWNDAFDRDGIPPRDGTTVEHLSRSLRK